jgi:hypothetical protein
VKVTVGIELLYSAQNFVGVKDLAARAAKKKYSNPFCLLQRLVLCMGW